MESYHRSFAAERAKGASIRRLQKGQLPASTKAVEISAGADGNAVANILLEDSLTTSNSESCRMASHSAVKIEGERLFNAKRLIDADQELSMQVGKRRVARVSLRQDPMHQS